MAERSSRSDPLDHYLQLLAEDALDETDRASLEALLRDDADARSRYARYMAMHAWLQWECADLAEGASPAPAEAPSPSILARLLHQDGGQRPLWREYPGRFALATVAITGLAWALFLFAVLPWWHDAQPPVAVVAKQNAVATLVAVRDVQWGEEATTWQSGGRISPQAVIDLAAGHAEVVFDSGARATLAGPARFKITSRNAGDLELGKLHAEVPRIAVGFTVATRALTVVDLGTEFGLAVEPSGRTEVRVFAGRVEARDDQQSIQLAAGEAIRSQNGSLQRLTGAESTLVRIERLYDRSQGGIAWDPPRAIRGPDDLAGPGVVVEAANLGASRVTVAGIPFEPTRIFPGAHAGMLNGHTTGDAALDRLLNEANIGGGKLTGFTLTELTPGAHYTLQLVYCDGRPSSAGRPMIFCAATSPDAQAVLINNQVNADRGPFGRTVVGRFQATSTRLPLLIQTHKANNAHLNAYVLRQIKSPPEQNEATP